ncbi:MAG TPA: ACP S-malonyltransferase [Candidatus Dormibacteraeota bacterium]|nr:ACP S-malonyltransferase [Candidatus Dormibacteraeota bacterium]
MVGAGCLFPGQGSQSVGMGRALAERYPEARAVFAEADQVLGFALSTLCFEGPAEELTRTENTQPALLATSVAAFRVLEARGLKPAAAAGHSAGEYAAHVAAGSLTLAEGLRLIRRRGEAMAGAEKERPGTMAAVLGLSVEQIQDVLRTVDAPRDLAAANYNSPGQVVLSGTPEAVARASEEARRAGAKKVVPLQVSAAFHSPLMEAASRGLGEAIAHAPIARARFPVYANVTAAPVSEPEMIRDTLRKQLLSPVLWEQTMRAMREAGIRQYVEVGNGRILRGLVRGVDKEAVVFGSEDPDSIEAAAVGIAETATR